MKKIRLQRPSFATTLAFIALMVALGGTTYAAMKLPKNSVSSKQLKKNSVTGAKIKKNAVTGAKVKDQSLTGKDINLAQLGTVPSAQTANSLAPAEPVHLVGAPGEPGFEGGANNFGGEAGILTELVGFYKDHDGIVHLQGVARVGTALFSPIFSLPPGFRPASGAVALFNALCFGESGECDSDSNGDEEGYARVLITGSNVNAGMGIVFNGAVVGENGTAMSLDGITFRAKS